LQAGESLSAITDQFFQAHGIAAHALPASDDPVRTMIHAADGRQLIFQNYFVEERCKPEVRDFTYAGATSAVANPGIIAALRDPALRAVVLCPSNPFVSINPILAVPGIRDALCACPAPIVGVSPIVGGAAIKGPLAKMFYELGQPANCTSVLDHYRDFLTGFIVDHADAEEAKGWDIPTCVTSTIMKTLEDRDALAVAALEFAGELARHDRK
ncbi:MAG: 2-phospho-L-lactate transferase, partial [Rhodospirillaceae bacterium]|nr:2-phospho-L-lactate transferase [Rhodospirillaceae bacterium]